MSKKGRCLILREYPGRQSNVILFLPRKTSQQRQLFFDVQKFKAIVSIISKYFKGILSALDVSNIRYLFHELTKSNLKLLKFNLVYSLLMYPRYSFGDFQNWNDLFIWSFLSSYVIPPTNIKYCHQTRMDNGFWALFNDDWSLRRLDKL